MRSAISRNVASRRRSRPVSGLLAIGLAGALALPAATAHGQLLPPNANFRGTSFEEWNVLATEWTIATGLGGQDLPDTVDGVRFLSGAFSPGVYEFDIQIRPGTGLVFPSFFVFGELYEDGTRDEPAGLEELIQFIYETTFVETTVDGKLVLQGTGDDLVDYQYGVADFDEPIFYEEPQPRGDFPDAVAALWTFGIGSVYRPLSAGEHTLVSVVDSLFFGRFEYTYRIHVVPRGRR